MTEEERNGKEKWGILDGHQSCPNAVIGKDLERVGSKIAVDGDQ